MLKVTSNAAPSKPKVGRPARGTVVRTRDGRYQPMVTLADGSRMRLSPLPQGTSKREAQRIALKEAVAAQAKERVGAEPAGPVAEGETLQDYAERWVADRERRGLATAAEGLGTLKRWVFPTLGPRALNTITVTDVRQLVADFDATVQAGASWQTARNAWVLVAKLLDDASNAKSPALRVLGANPAVGVRGPDRGGQKAKCYLHPSEFQKFVKCDAVPLRWRRMVALSVYLVPRASELDALEWSDVDVERGIVHVHQALDRSRKGTKPTKTKGTRRFAVEPALLPLLRAMHTEASGQGLVLGNTVKLTGRCEKLRAFLRRAEVDRAELFAATETQKPLTWHDLRATGLTWMAVRGDDPLKIQQRAGHTDFTTTQGYIREAEAVREGFGDVFPALPKALVGPTFARDFRTRAKNLNHSGAGHGTRTRDPELGKLMLYQLS